MRRAGGQSQCGGNLWTFRSPRLFLFVESWLPYIFQAGLKLIMKPNMTYELLTLLLKPTQYWSYRHAPSDLVGGFLRIRCTEYKVKFSTK